MISKISLLLSLLFFHTRFVHSNSHTRIDVLVLSLSCLISTLTASFKRLSTTSTYMLKSLYLFHSPLIYIRYAAFQVATFPSIKKLLVVSPTPCNPNLSAADIYRFLKLKDSLNQRFSNRVSRKLWLPQNIVRGSERNSVINT